MPKPSFILAVLVGLATMVACGDSPARPSQPPTPPPPPGPFLTSLQLEGPGSIPPGESVQLRLIATLSNGASNDVAALATWTSDNASVLSFSPTGGVAKAGARGEAHISARYQGQSRQALILVLENGTFRVRGSVTESGAGLAGARVEVVSGTGAGLAATTGPSGSYALYGVAGDVQLDVTLNGFEKERRTVVVSEHTTINVELRPLIPPTDLRGDWRLTMSASTACVPAAAADASSRIYMVTIAQTGTLLQIQVKAPVMLNAEWLKISGRVIDRTVTIMMPVDDFYYPFYGIKFYAVQEILGPGRILVIAGTARGDRLGDVVTGSLDGEFALYRNENNGAVWNQDFSCQRSDHGFRLDRD
jgi:hypothetical protein